MRHSIADTTLPNHEEHPLSSMGVLTATSRREEFRPAKGFQMVFASPLIRTKQTARIIAGLKNEDPVIERRELFYAPTEGYQKKVDEMFEQYGHAPLGTYYADPRARALQILAERAFESVNFIALMAKVRDRLAVSHGVITPAIVNYYAEKVKASGRKVVGGKDLMDVTLAPTDGFILTETVKGLWIRNAFA